jgi:hypothetical protein
MAVKTFLCVSLLFSLLVFDPLCGLQGVKASPTSRIFEKQLNSLRNEYSEKTSVVETRFSGAGKSVPVGAEFGEVLITEEIYKRDEPFNATLSVTDHNGYLVHSLSCVTYWFGGQGVVSIVDGGIGFDHWAIKWEVPRLVSATSKITVVLYREVSENFRLSYEHCNSGLSQFHALTRQHYSRSIYPAVQL